MNDTFSAVVGFMQLLLLALLEAIGVFYFGWAPVAILLCWGAGIFTYNVAIATALRTYIKLTTPPAETADNIVNIAEARITEEDGVA